MFKIFGFLILVFSLLAELGATKFIQWTDPSELPKWVELLKSGNEKARKNAVHKISLIYPFEKASPAIPHLQKELENVEDEKYKYKLVGMLTRLGASSDEINEYIMVQIEQTKNEDEQKRQTAVWNLGRLFINDEKVVQALTQSLKDESSKVRRLAASALGKSRPITEEGLNALITSLRNDDEFVKREVLQALKKMLPKSKVAFPEIMRTLKDSNYWVRRYSLDILGELGEDAKEALPTLLPMLEESDVKLLSSVIEAIGKIGAKEAVKPLIEYLKSGIPGIRSASAEALGNMGSLSEEAVPYLTKGLKDKHSTLAFSESGDYTMFRVGLNCFQALEKIGTPKALAGIKGFKEEDFYKKRSLF